LARIRSTSLGGCGRRSDTAKTAAAAPATATTGSQGSLLTRAGPGDACGTTRPLHGQTLEQINNCYAPVMTTEAAIGHIQAGLRAGRTQSTLTAA
jgi:hypothetical protein